MGAAAQLGRGGPAIWLVAHAHDPDLVAIFFAEQRHGAGLDRLVASHDPDRGASVLADEVVDLGLDRGALGRAHRLGMAEVEAQPVGGDQRALLGDVVAELAAQRRVQQMGRRMGPAEPLPAAAVDRQLDRVADLEGSAGELADMDEQIARALLRVGHGDDRGAALERAGIADLAAALPVEGGLVGHHHDLGAGLGARDRLAVDHQAHDLRLGGLMLVAQELGGAQGFAQLEPDARLGLLAGALPAGARLGPLALHGRLEAGEIDGHALGAQGVLGQIERKAVGVVELEGGLAGQLAAHRQARGRLLEQAQAAFQGLAKARFLELQQLGDQGLGAAQLLVGQAHLGDQDRHQAPHQGLLGAQELGMAHRPAHDPAQDVAAAFVGRHDAIGDQEGRSAQVVRDHLEGRARGTGGRLAGQLLARLDQAAEQVDVVVILLALKDRGDPLQAHAGVDRGPGQGLALAALDLLKLHEDQIPELQEPVAVLVGRARRAAGDRGALVIEDLGAGAAGAGVAHHPEIIVSRDPDDPVLGQAGDLAPQLEGVVVLVVDRDPQAVLGQAPFLGHQLPGKLDRERLEVVAEGEVAQHLEEGVMPGGVADIVEIVVLAAGAHDFLRRGGALVVALLDAGEQVLELDHAGIGEQQRRVVMRHQRRGGDDLVVVLLEVVEKRLTDLVGAGHGRLPAANDVTQADR